MNLTKILETIGNYKSQSDLDRRGSVETIGNYLILLETIKPNQIWTDEGQLKLQIPPPLASLAATQVIFHTNDEKESY